MAFGQYILDENGNPVPEPDLLKWAMWLEHSHRSKGKDNRILQQDRFIRNGQSVFVSTVFLGLDQRHRTLLGERGKPVLWETMIFGGEHHQWMDRYTSREDALIGHAIALAMAKGELEQLEKLYELKDTRE